MLDGVRRVRQGLTRPASLLAAPPHRPDSASAGATLDVVGDFALPVGDHSNISALWTREAGC